MHPTYRSILQKLTLTCLLVLVTGIATEAWADINIAEDLLVDLRSEDLAPGPVTEWPNHGSLGGSFTAVGTPTVEDVGGWPNVVSFDGSNYFEGPPSSPGIDGPSPTRTVEVWAYKIGINGEQTMVHWGRRGGPDGTNMTFNYGNNASFGAVGHWGAPDMGWGGNYSPNPPTDTWWHLVYTHDGTTTRLYVNGEAAGEEDHNLDTYPGHPIRVAAQGDGTGNAAQTQFNFVGAIAQVRIHDGVLTPEQVLANSMIRIRNFTNASQPKPDNALTDVLRNATLGWRAGESAATHDVYFGMVRADVEAATPDASLGVLVSQGQSGTTYAPAELLEYGQTYYWRVDEVETNGTVYAGEVWSFTAEPFSLPITQVTATASSFSSAVLVPENVVNGSGLNELDQHSTNSQAMWLTLGSDLEPWIQFEFDRIYKLDEMWVWNQNQVVEASIGFGFKDVTVETSLDGADWTLLEGVSQFAQAPGEEGYEHNTTVDFAGLTARFVRITSQDNWGDAVTLSGLSEVRHYFVPTYAREPQPADGASVGGVDVVLGWRAGRDSTGSEVYMGTDGDNLALLGSTSQASFDTSAADPLLGETYYWKVDEMDGTDSWPGPIWQFTTPDALSVDDFESYDADEPEDPEAIFNVWVDGFADDNNSSVVGHSASPFAEQTIARGDQSMPFFYGEGNGAVAEATRTFAPAQDWARAGIQTLVLYFYGDAANAEGSLYVKINGTRIDFDSTNATQSPLWKQWNIDLASVGTNLTQVTSMTIGVDSSGSGLLFLDDILLYRSAPEIILPVDPGTGALVLHYDMENTVQDVTGNGYDGTQVDGTTFVAGRTGLGTALQFSGQIDHVDLPIGPLVATLSDATFATWVDFANGGGAWQRILDFGSGTSSYVFLSPRTGTTGPVRAAINGGAGESLIDSPNILPSGWHHVALVFNSDSMTMQLFIDGDNVAEGPTTTLPADLGETTQNWLGRSQFAADGYYMGSLDEFQIYNRALTAAEIRYLAGDR